MLDDESISVHVLEHFIYGIPLSDLQNLFAIYQNKKHHSNLKVCSPL